MPDDREIIIEDAQLVFRNFSGREDQYNRAGDRNFCVLLPDDLAERLVREGWNVKELAARDEDEGGTPQPYIQVRVNFRGRPPRIVMITSRGRNYMTEDDVETLDWADFKNVDMIMRPYEWTMNGKSGIKAYLQSIYVTIEEDPLELKYAEIEDA